MLANLLIASLPESDKNALQAILRPIELAQQTILVEAGGTVENVYFPTTAIVSLVVALSDGLTIEAAMVGRDGVVGASAALDSNLSLSRAIVQINGLAFTCTTSELKSLALKSEAFLSKLIRHEQAVLAQSQQSAACMAAHHVEARLCRWLLRAHYLSQETILPFTQEFLAEMLGVQRTSVSVVAHVLQQAGLIKYTRGRIQILDLEALNEAACECYETVHNHYRTLLDGKGGER